MFSFKHPAFSFEPFEPIPLRLMVWQGTTALHRFAAESLHLGPEPLVALLCTGVDVLAGDDQGHHALRLAQERYEETHGEGGLGRELAPLIGGDRSLEALNVLEEATLEAARMMRADEDAWCSFLQEVAAERVAISDQERFRMLMGPEHQPSMLDLAMFRAIVNLDMFEEAKKRMAERWALRAIVNREATTTTAKTRCRL
ncbi:hypothetical protein KDW85_27065 [Burkholderia cenocepacia]|uniref:hypothetical protein n=1 Tax=Burkholderia cenocepacia TaxID=95486 RepID=UPI001B918983|nr:hypothetical protein [Burkholderia cenocepacia]MBR8042066.1 hypothetical protein [Burkholderia cenocepacia]